jgi:hypothetical protein
MAPFIKKKKGDLTAIEKVRLICLKSRRRSQRALPQCKGLMKSKYLLPDDKDRLQRQIAFFETCIALTKPSWVKKASLDELVPVLEHMCKESH